MPAISDVPTSFSYPHAVEDGDEEVHDAMSELASDRAERAFSAISQIVLR
jgi:hypothetical protein